MKHLQKYHSIIISILVTSASIEGMEFSTTMDIEQNDPNNSVRIFPWRLIFSTFLDKGWIKWQDNDENSHYLELDVIHFFDKAYNEQRLTRSQSDFITYFKLQKLPCTITPDQKRTLESFRLHKILFAFTKKKKGYLVQRAEGLPCKIKNLN